MHGRDTVVWISGASSGIGAALAATQPYAGARLINLDIKPTAAVEENILFDLTDPATWGGVQRHFGDTLADPEVQRAIFLHCAYAPIGKGIASLAPADDYDRSLIANLAGSLAIAASFVRSVRQGQETGLLVMTSGAAKAPLLGYSSYGASKAALEHWARIVQAEMTHRGWGPWVVALRPGLVRTDTACAASNLPPELFPLGEAMRSDFERRAEDVEAVARRIWSSLPPEDGCSLIHFAAKPSTKA